MRSRITELDSDGSGLSARSSIWYALPGEEVESEKFGKVRRVVEIITKSPLRVEPSCIHFGKCGGCSLQHLRYEEQVAHKSTWLSSLFSRSVEVLPSPKQDHFRNRMDYVLIDGKLGLREKGTWKYVVDVEQCPIFSGESILQKNSAFLKSLPGKKGDSGKFESKKSDEIFHYAVIRGHEQNGILCLLCTSKGREYISLLKEKIRDVPNICLSIYDGASDISMSDTIEVIKGDPYYIDSIGDCSFKVPVNGFFQPNTSQAAQMYAHVKSLVEGDEIVDLFCGVGSIGIFCKPKKLFGVEVVKESIDYAKENAARNGVHDAHFSCIDLFTISTVDIPGENPTIIVDPPRCGLQKKTIQALLRKHCTKLIYVSCNHHSLRDDLDKLTERFEIKSMKGFDMFPHTAHVEVVVELVPKSSL